MRPNRMQQGQRPTLPTQASPTARAQMGAPAPQMSAPMAAGPTAAPLRTGPIAPPPPAANPGGQMLPSQANPQAQAQMQRLAGGSPPMPNKNANPMALQQARARMLRGQQAGPAMGGGGAQLPTMPTPMPVRPPGGGISMPAPMPTPTLQPAPQPAPQPVPESPWRLRR